MPLGKDLWIHNNGLSIICLKDVCVFMNEPILSWVEVLDNYVVAGSVFSKWTHLELRVVVLLDYDLLEGLCVYKSTQLELS